MLPHTLPPGETYDAHVRPLHELTGDLRGHALTVDFVPDVATPHVIVQLVNATITVTLTGGRFRWGKPPADHPILDPAGCARRIATSLRRGL